MLNDETSRTRAQASRQVAKDVVKLVKALCPDLDTAQEAKVVARTADMPERCRRGYLRAMGGKSRPASNKAFCLECVSWEREEVRLCTAPACPLWPYRPFK